MNYSPTVSQKLIWLDQAIAGHSSKYNIGGYAILEGSLSYDVFEHAIRSTLASQEVYSSVFREVEGTVTCSLRDVAADYVVDIIDFSTREDPAHTAISWMEDDFARSFVMEDNYLFTIKLLKISAEMHYWYAKIHHIISDGWSFKLLLNQTAGFYSQLLKEGETTCVYKYSDYALEDEAYYQSEVLSADRDYWLNEYNTIPAELFRRLPRSLVTSNAGNSETLYLSAGSKQIMQEFAEENKISLFHLITGLLLVYFSRTRSQQDIAVGVPVLNRTKKIYRNTAGVFMNLLSLKFNIQPEDTFLQLLGRIKQHMSASLRHQRYQYGNLVSDLQLPPGKLLYDIRVSYEDFDFSADFGSLKASAIALSNHAEVDKLAIYLRDYNGQGFDVRFVYDNNYFNSSMIRSICQSLEFMVMDLPAIKDRKIQSIVLLSAKQRNEILSLSSGPVQERVPSGLQMSWEYNVARYGDSVAISVGVETYTYREIDLRACALASVLREKRKAGHQRLALLLPRNEKMIIGMLGSIMAGMTYIPLDPDSPPMRNLQVLKDANCDLLIVTNDPGVRDLSGTVPCGSVKNIDGHDFLNTYDPDTTCQRPEILTIEGLITVPAPDSRPGWCTAVPENPCYIIYTSGTTGIPKGVVITYASLDDYVSTFRDYFHVCRQDVVLQQASVSFDTSVEEIFPVLAAGGRLVIAEDRKDLTGLPDLIEIEHVSIISTSPLVLKFLDEHMLPSSIRLVISGGDVLRSSYIKNFLRRQIPVFNTYGPTESTVCATYHKVEEDDDPIPVGRPITNREVYILDDHLQLQPLGAEGDIFLGGAGLAAGYLYDGELTGRRFIGHPFRKSGKLYQTGDRGIMLDNGNVLFMGRRDDQLKYRGYRVEAGEIEKIILACSAVEDCIVMVREFRNDPLLVAYIKYGKQRPLSLKEWRLLIKPYLHDYMIPEVWKTVEQWPLSANGKIEKGLLPSIEEPEQEAGEEGIAPGSGLEKTISHIWEEILGRRISGVDRSFFESGGHSLNVGQLINRYYKEFGVKISVRELFQYTTISAHAELIGSKRTTAYDPIIKISESADYAVSDGQRRLWLLDHWEENAQAYYLSGQVWLNGDYDPLRMEEAVSAVIFRHEILRTIFRVNEVGELRQVVLASTAIPFRLDYIVSDQNDLVQVEEYVRQFAATPFDLSKGPLLRAGLIRLGDGSCLFHYTMHHIICDGWSMELLVKEILLYNERLKNSGTLEPMPLPIQYKDYAAWQQAWMLHEDHVEHKKYWLHKLAGDLPVLQLPADRRRPSVRTSNGYLWTTTFDSTLVKDFRSLCDRNQCTVFMGLLGILSTLGMRYSDQEDMIIGTVVAGRSHCELEEQIGYYANTLALRVRCEGDDSFTDLLHKIRNITLSAYDHQDYPFDRLVEDLGLKKDPSRSPLFDILLLLQNQHESNDGWYRSGGIGELAGEREKSVMYDLIFNFWEINDELHLHLEFNTDLYSRSFIIGLAEHFKNLMARIVQDPDQLIDRIDFLSDAEKTRILNGFNDTGYPYPTRESIVSLFAKQVDSMPDQPAVVFPGRSLTYQELDRESDRLARRLRNRGVLDETLIPVWIERSVEMIVGILGILKAGAAYVPLDPAYPPKRISYICADTGARWVVARKDHGLLPEVLRNMEMIYLDQEEEPDPELSKQPLPHVDPHNLAYVIYTSGSTGTPKGVMIEHTSVVNLSLGQAWLLKLYPGLRALQFSSFGFDASCYEIFNTLLSQGTLVIPSNEELLSVDLFLAFIKKFNVQLAVLPPSFYSAFLQEDLSPLETIISAGEPLNIEAGRVIQSKKIKLINAYGPTEITVCASLSAEPIRSENKVTIGRPVPNARIYILDRNRNLQPIGIPGELYIGGPGLARAYLNNPGLTDGSFIQDPFGGPHDRLYRSRDLGKWLPDGNIEYLGRADQQVKISGFRIEPGEIEHALVRLPGVSHACVLPRTRKDGERFLVAYLQSENDLTIAWLRQQLSEMIPQYMIPAAFVLLGEMPVTVNGKIDKEQLNELDVKELSTGAPYVPPKNEIESLLVRIYEEVLQRHPISIRDNFFELGGNSMLLIRIRAALHRELNIRLNIRELYRALTIGELADTIAALQWLQERQTQDKTQMEEEFLL